MRVHVLYFYQEIDEITSSDIGNELIHNSPLVVSIDKAIKLQSNLIFNKVRPFELQQDRLVGLVLKAKHLNIQIVQIEFTQEVEQEIEEELLYAIRSQDTNQAIKLLQNVLHHYRTDVFAVSFIQDERHYRLTKYAVAEIPCELYELNDLAFSPPIEFVTGIKKYPSEREVIQYD